MLHPIFVYTSGQLPVIPKFYHLHVIMMLGKDGAQGRVKKDTRETEIPGQANPYRLSGTWVQAKGGKGGAGG